MGKTYSSVSEMFKEMEAEDKQYKKKYPVRWLCKKIYYALYRFWNHRFRYIPKEIKWFFQRGNQGYADFDVWGFADYLSEVIVGGLKQLKKIKHGVPNYFCIYKNDKELKKANKDWEKTLDKMIYTFETAKQIMSHEFNYLPNWSKYQKAKMRKQGFKVLTKRQEKKYEEGWALFQKHFFSLWD